MASPLSFSLADRRALVTGGGTGIGAACAQALAAAGAKVMVMGRRAEPLAGTCEQVAAAGGQASMAVCDVTDQQEFERVLDEQGEAFDIFVCNAGTARHERFGAVTPAAFDEVFALNFQAAFLNTQAVARRLVDAGRPGSLVLMSSQMGHVGGQERSVYCATKHALEGMAKAAAIDLAPRGIRINTVCPTFVATSWSANNLEDPQFVADFIAPMPLGRVATPEEVAAAVVYLACDASAMTTGSALKVDGGWTAR